jgi:uncharacterized membrane protein
MKSLPDMWANRARVWQFVETTNDSFWLRPALIVGLAVALAELLTGLERSQSLPNEFLSSWVYTGGETGARTLLGAVAGSTIAVVSTLFSITIATLTLASNQMGPRLLRNFTRDRANQSVLGIYLGTFAYALLVLRTVRGAEETAFVPHLAVSGAIVLSLLCVAMLIFFVHHVASRINSETVIELVYRDLEQGIEKWTTLEPQKDAPPDDFWSKGRWVNDERSGFIQQLDEKSIADWAHEHGVAIRLYARAGDFVFPGAPIALVVPPTVDPTPILHSAIALGGAPTASMDIEFTISQLVDIAVRALSPGINDPNTAIRVLDYLGSALCVITTRSTLTGVFVREDRVVFQRDTSTYDGITDAMLNVIRQNAADSPAVLIRMVEVLSKVAQCTRTMERLATIERHAALIKDDAVRAIVNPADLAALIGRVDRLSLILSSRR